MPNRLVSEKSPYLRQHADNPVDWFPWGPEALELAQREDRPILLSIGYAACHWCHVMERESFEDGPTAARMNELFVNIKVDREERPDLDHIYQLVAQLLGRSGGWPLTVFLTPDQRPFYAGTYFPPRDRYGMPGFSTLLDALAEAYRERRVDIDAQAQELTLALGKVDALSSRASEQEPGARLLELASKNLLVRFDHQHGGFGSRPKFPSTMALEVLLRRGVLEGDPGAKGAALLALERMREGGIWDHLRGGFARYSTDERWLVPHFEKMLCDNALLLRLYVDGWRASGDARHAETARAIVGYLFAEMRSSEGAFYSSQDADSEGEEGKYFVFTAAEVAALLADDPLAATVAREHYGLTPEGNFERSGASVLAAARPLERVAADQDVSLDEARAALERARVRLLEARSMRAAPTTDDKVLASWNALAIGALADAAIALDEPTWLEAAVKAFDVIERVLVEDGRVARFMKDGVRGGPSSGGFLDDHAYLGNAALDLYEATGEPRFVRTAQRIARGMLERFWDDAAGGFFFAPADGETLIARTKDVFDQSIPAAASTAALLCLRLGGLVDEALVSLAERQLAPLAAAAASNPFGLAHAVATLDRLSRGSTEVVIVGEPAAAQALVRAASRAYLPNRMIARLDPARPETLAVASLLAADKPPPASGAVAYVCRGRVCSPPVAEPAELEAMLVAR